MATTTDKIAMIIHIMFVVTLSAACLREYKIDVSSVVHENVLTLATLTVVEWSIVLLTVVVLSIVGLTVTLLTIVALTMMSVKIVVLTVAVCVEACVVGSVVML